MIVLPDFSPTPNAKPSVKNGGRTMRQNDIQALDAASIDDRFAARFMQQVSPDFNVDFVEATVDVIEAENTDAALKAESDAQASGNLRPDNAAAEQLLALLNPAAGIQLNAGSSEKSATTLDEQNGANEANRTANLPIRDIPTTAQTRTNRLDVGNVENTVQRPTPDTRHTPNPAPTAQTETTRNKQAALLSALKSTTALTGLPSLSSGAEPSPLLTPNQTLLPAAPSTTFISSGTAPVPTAITLPLTPPFNQSDWGQAMMQQVVQTLANGKQIQHAELRLNPPDLGTLQVTLRIEGAHAQAWFASPHAAVREAVHSALPELAQQLQQAGLALNDAQVGSEQRQFAASEHASEQAFAQSHRHSQNQNPSRGSTPNPSQSPTPTVPSNSAFIQTPVTATRGLLRVDTYA